MGRNTNDNVGQNLSHPKTVLAFHPLVYLMSVQWLPGMCSALWQAQRSKTDIQDDATHSLMGNIGNRPINIDLNEKFSDIEKWYENKLRKLNLKQSQKALSGRPHLPQSQQAGGK